MIKTFYQLIAKSPVGYGYAAASAVASCLLGFMIPGQWALPLLNTLLIYPLFFFALQTGNLKYTFKYMLVWVVFLSLSIIGLTLIFPQHAGEQIFRGLQYREEMFAWIRTGIGTESNPAKFIPMHALHFLVFTVATILSGGFLGLLMGSVLMNYMNFYVASLIMESHYSWTAISLGWSWWSVVRVLGYITWAIAISYRIWAALLTFKFNRIIYLRFLTGGIALVCLDILLKICLSAGWQELLQPVLK